MISCKEFNQKNYIVKYYLVTEWQDIINISINNKDCFFRGQSDASWGLVTSLERAGGMSSHGEMSTLLECMRGGTNYLESPVPGFQDYYEWLCIMQHYGAPTRLLDVSRSAFIALFFAICDLQTDNDACLWCFNPALSFHRFYNDISEVYGKGQPDFTPTFMENETVGIALANAYIDKSNNINNINFPEKLKIKREEVIKRHSQGGILILPPQRQTKRSLAQQGEFLFPINLEMTFEQNLLGMIGQATSSKHFDFVENNFSPYVSRYSGVYPFLVEKYIIPHALRHKFLYELKHMNISYKTLFPDIYGFMKDIEPKAKILKKW